MILTSPSLLVEGVRSGHGDGTQRPRQSWQRGCRAGIAARQRPPGWSRHCAAGMRDDAGEMLKEAGPSPATCNGSRSLNLTLKRQVMQRLSRQLLSTSC